MIGRFTGFVLLLLMACQEEPAPLITNFYHWETRLELDATKRQLLDSFASQRLYVKAFDVIWEGGAVPATPVDLATAGGLPQLVPVVFITNEVMANLGPAGVDRLAEDVLRYTDELLPMGYASLQFDCDWTARTQVPYFRFLSRAHELRPSLSLSCTLRLHQYRDRNAQGIPPVGRATLMAYNTGNLGEWETENSIVDTAALAYYLEGQPAYPVPLDIALAVYDWAAVYRHGDLARLINEPDCERLRDTSYFERLAENRYRATMGTYLNGGYLYEGDLIRLEGMGPEQVSRYAEEVRAAVGSFPGQELLLYRLGSRQWRAGACGR